MAQFSGVAENVSLSASTAKTIIQLVPLANTPIRLVELSVSFDSTTSSDPMCLVEVLRQSTAGTASALTLVNDQEDNSKTAQLTAQQTFTIEPTAGNILRAWKLTPVGGLLVMEWLPEVAIVAMTNRLALRVTPGSAINGAVTVCMTVREGA